MAALNYAKEYQQALEQEFLMYSTSVLFLQHRTTEDTAG